MSYIRSLAGAFALFVLAGCGAGTTDVSGSVTYKGKAVTSGFVTFASPSGVAASAEIRGDGTYAATGVPTGPVKVAVGSPDPTTAPAADGGRKAGPKAATKSPPPKAEGWVPLPAKYGRPEDSGLTVTLSGKPEVYNIKLD